MSRRGAWKTREAARAEAPPDLVERVQVAFGEARKIDPRPEQEEREAAAVALGDKLDAAKRKAGAVPGAGALIAEAVALTKAQAANAVFRLRRISTVRAASLERGRGGAGGWLGPAPGRAALVRSLLSFTTPSPGAADLALAAIAAGIESPPADEAAWKRLKVAFTVELARHSK